MLYKIFLDISKVCTEKGLVFLKRKVKQKGTSKDNYINKDKKGSKPLACCLISTKNISATLVLYGSITYNK